MLGAKQLRSDRAEWLSLVVLYRHGSEWEGTQLKSVNPGGVISQYIDPSRVIGCVVYPSTEIVEPGVVWHMEGTRFAIGEPDGSKSERCRRIADSLINAGLRCPVCANIRHDIWVKLMGNVAYNPISALTRAACEECQSRPRGGHHDRGRRRRQETGIDMGISVEQRLKAPRKWASTGLDAGHRSRQAD
jgi:2-dehydropantoate 2-reductase